MNTVTTNNHIAEWVWAILSIAYVLSPVDAIPDVPVIGWVDDFFVASVGSLNLVQAYASDTNPRAAQVLKLIKWILIILGVISILLVLLLGTL